jgi:hypothetical protein
LRAKPVPRLRLSPGYTDNSASERVPKSTSCPVPPAGTSSCANWMPDARKPLGKSGAKHHETAPRYPMPGKLAVPHAPALQKPTCSLVGRACQPALPPRGTGLCQSLEWFRRHLALLPERKYKENHRRAPRRSIQFP